jgi:hypothetical protein
MPQPVQKKVSVTPVPWTYTQGGKGSVTIHKDGYGYCGIVSDLLPKQKADGSKTPNHHQALKKAQLQYNAGQMGLTGVAVSKNNGHQELFTRVSRNGKWQWQATCQAQMPSESIPAPEVPRSGTSADDIYD